MTLKDDTTFVDTIKSPKAVLINEYNELGRLYYFCKIWGFIKYNDEELDIAQIDWNNELILFLNHVGNLSSKQEYRQKINGLIDKIEHKREIQTNAENLPDISRVDYSWFNDTIYLNNEISKKLWNILKVKKGRISPYIKRGYAGTPKATDNFKDYIDFPDENIRLLGFFTYWNVINYFYEYKNMMDENWDSVLVEMIPDFKNHEDNYQYNLSVLKLISKLNDGHSIAHSKIIDTEIFYNHVPNFRVRQIDGSFYIKKRRIDYWKDNFKIGDEVLLINNKSPQYIYDSVQELRGFSNQNAAQIEVNGYMFLTKDSTLNLKVKRNNNELFLDVPCNHWRNIVAKENEIADSIKESQSFKIITDNIFYLNINYLDTRNINRILRKANKFNNIILDLRGYPEFGVSVALFQFFLKGGEHFYTGITPDLHYPGTFKATKGFINSNSKSYNGKLILLVDENTMSEAEFLTMALQKAENVTTIGNKTAGADGNATFYNFPGNIDVSFSGMGIYYPDYSPTQRIGIRIDYLIEPTVNDIKEKRDAILNYALMSIVEKLNLKKNTNTQSNSSR